MGLISKKCIPCENGTKLLTKEEAEKSLKGVNGWQAGPGHKKIWRDFKFKNFNEAMTFINKVADIAELEDHHPDIHVFYNKVNLELWTHAVDGLSENDFILAAKINAITI